MYPKIIAEIGWNHMGDLDLAKKMILAAHENGADYIKTQIFSIKNLKDGPWMKDGRKEIYEKAQLNEKKYAELYKFCLDKKIRFFSSIFNIESAKVLLSVHNNLVKIPSMESRNKELLKFSNQNFNKILISTGTSTQEEIINTQKLIESKKSSYLHCVSSYPCVPENANLPRINFMKTLSKEFGFSDHTIGIEVSKLSFEYNITYLEKHFTIDQSLPGRDNKFAILPKDLKNLVEFRNMRNVANKFHGNDYLQMEKEAREVYSGRWG
tara:strand:- start:131 stop:931 length:801 start_codon:yes stop_codon:yes gene_type:complete